MARPKTPTKILELKGSFKKDPQRSRTGEPEPELGIGEPPKDMSENKAAIWREVDSQLVAGVLTISDRKAFELLVDGLYEIKYGVERMHPQTGDLITVPATRLERESVFKMLGKFGMTPSDRANIVVPEKKQDQKFGNL